MAWKHQQRELEPLLSGAAGGSVEADRFKEFPVYSDLPGGKARTPKEAYICIAQAAQLVVKCYDGVQQLRLQAQQGSVEEKACSRLLRVCYSQLTNLLNVHEAGATLSNAIQHFRTNPHSKQQLAAAANEYAAAMARAVADNARSGDVLIGRWEMNQVLKGRAHAAEMQQLMWKLNASGLWVSGGAVAGVGAFVIIDMFVDGGLITGVTAATAAAVAAGLSPAVACVTGALLMAGTQYYMGEKRSISAEAGPAVRKLPELYDYLVIDSPTVMNSTYAGVARMKEFASEVAAAAAGEGEDPRSKLAQLLNHDCPPLMLAPAELMSVVRLLRAGGHGIIAADERDADVGHALYNWRCKLPKGGLPKGWGGGAVSILNRTDEEVRILLKAGWDKRIDQMLAVNHEVHRACYLVHHTLCVYNNGQKVAEKTVYGSSDWVLFKKGSEFRLGDRRKLQQLLRDC